MADPATLAPVFAGAYGVYSVQNPVLSGVAGEIRQGKTVADAARQAGVRHLVYGSAGVGVRDTGVPSWDSKQVIEAYLQSLGLPLTILRPMAFMELMTEKKFFPPVAVWHVMPQIMGGSRPVGWLAVDDLGLIAAQAFADPERFIGQELRLASDVQTLDACRAIYRQVTGQDAPRFPMPAWMFKRLGFVGRDLTLMWDWLRRETFDLDTTTTRTLHPQAATVQSWLAQQHSRPVSSNDPLPS
jgi:uncharacterized protein YbjT (DUF2867 family)